MVGSSQDTRDERALCPWAMVFHGNHIRTMIDERDQSFWGHAGDVGDLFGIVNIHTSITRIKSKWKRTIRGTDSTGRERDMLFLSEQALYQLAFRSNKPEAEEFTERVADLLVDLRSGKLELRPRPQDSEAHLAEGQQKRNSISYNRQLYLEGGEDELRKRNGLICKALSDKGLSPEQLKEWARAMGRPSKDRTSGQQVLRVEEPWSACASSFAKNLLQMGMPWDEAMHTAKESKAIFARMLRYMRPAELDQ